MCPPVCSCAVGTLASQATCCRASPLRPPWASEIAAATICRQQAKGRPHRRGARRPENASAIILVDGSQPPVEARMLMATNDDVARPAARAGAPSRARSLLHALLRCAASTPAAEADASRDLGPVRAEHEAQLQQVFEAGQAPLLFRAARENRIAIPPAWRSRLEAAEWCARVRYGSLVDAAAEVVDVCSGQQIPVTLLKGISTSEQYYAAPHERAMKDIDVLIPRDAFEIVEEQLLRRGYRRCEFAFDEHAYHGAPLFHDGRQVCVEIHFALFPPNDPLRRDALFNASHIETARWSRRFTACRFVGSATSCSSSTSPRIG